MWHGGQPGCENRITFFLSAMNDETSKPRRGLHHFRGIGSCAGYSLYWILLVILAVLAIIAITEQYFSSDRRTASSIAFFVTLPPTV